MFTLLLNKVFNQFVSLTLFTCTKIVPAFVLNLKYTPNYKPLCLSVVGIILWYNKINPNKFFKVLSCLNSAFIYQSFNSLLGKFSFSYLYKKIICSVLCYN